MRAQEPRTPRPAVEEAPLVIAPGSIYRELRRAIFLVAGLFLIYRMAIPLATLLLFFLLVFILAAVLNPIAAWLQARGIRRMFGAVLVVFSLLALLAVLACLALPPMLAQISGFVRQITTGQIRLGQEYERLLRHY